MRNASGSKPRSRAGRTLILPTTVALIYLVLAYLLVGPKVEQSILAGTFVLLYAVSSATRRWILGFSIFIVFWVLFDFMKAFPNYALSTVHIADLYQTERSIFGIVQEGRTLTPNEYWALRPTRALDVMSGLFYLCWMPIPLALAAYLYARNKAQFLHFSLTFFLVNMLGFVLYYLYPAAPPWYVDQVGYDLIHSTPGNAAGLGRFDSITGTSIFHSIYAKSSNVFAAMPSLHAAYPVVVLYHGLKYRLGWINLLFATIMCGIWFAAVYSGHHYVLDVLAGICCAVIGIALFERALRWPPFRGAFVRYERAIHPGGRDGN